MHISTLNVLTLSILLNKVCRYNKCTIRKSLLLQCYFDFMKGWFVYVYDNVLSAYQKFEKRKRQEYNLRTRIAVIDLKKAFDRE